MSDKQLIIGSVVVVGACLMFVCFAMLHSSDSLSPPKSPPITAQTAPANPPESPAEVVTSKPNKQRGKPFEHEILSEEWHDTIVGRAVTVKLQTPDDVAPKVTEEDLQMLAAELMEKYKGATFGAYFYTVTPLVNPWARISHLPHTDEKLEWYINDYAFEFGPWYFPDRIDPNVEWHKLVWITLPMANKIVNGATQYHWEVTNRSANEVYFDSKLNPKPGAMKDDMRLSPQTWEISTYDGDVPRFVRLVESSLNHLDYEFSQDIVGKLNSVIGSQEYLYGDKTHWTWMIDRLEVTYHHFDRNDTITIMQTTP